MKQYIIYAGVNGAGKSTLYYTSAHKNFPRINTDEMIQKRGDWKDTRLQMQVSKEAVKKIKEYFKNGVVFLEKNIMPQWFKQNILQGLNIMHEQSFADIPDER